MIGGDKMEVLVILMLVACMGLVLSPLIIKEDYKGYSGKKEKNTIVKLPKYTVCISAASILFCIVCIIIFKLNPKKDQFLEWIILVLSSGIAGGLGLAVSIRFRLELRDKHMVYTNMFGKKREIPYESIIEVKTGHSFITIKTESRKVFVDQHAINTYLLLDLMYRKGIDIY